MLESKRILKESKPVQNVYTIHENISELPKKLTSFELVMSQMNIASVEDFKQAYSKQWQSAAMEKELLSVLICEVDFYHEYVDNHGEQGASFMMVSIALLLQNICETNNYFLSYNEHHGFNVLVKGTSVEDLKILASEFCNAVESSKIAHEKSKINDIITLSVGTSSFYPTTPSIFKENAQKALEKAKVSGGNTIHCVSLAKAVELNAMTDVREPLSKDNETEIALTSDQINCVKEEERVIEKSTKNSQPFDFFAEEEQNKTSSFRIFRDKIFNNGTESKDMSAPRVSDSALNKSDEETKVEVVKKKEKPVRMYRGQVIRD